MLTLHNWFDHLRTLHQFRNTYNLDRIGIIADRLSLRKFNCPVIVITGTNGKGSVAKMLSTIYCEARYRPGLYTSPHLLEFNERIAIKNKNISDDDLIAAFSAVEHARADTVLSVFEFTTLAALFYFKNNDCDVMILEAGLGGRLDAVNIVQHDIAIVTSIALDHTAQLGPDRNSIAYEKTSVVRDHEILICGDAQPPEKFFEIAESRHARVKLIDRDFYIENNGDNIIYHGEKKYALPTPALKFSNVATAIAAIESLMDRIPVNENQIAAGIKNTVWPGRFEWTDIGFPIVLDVAHNPESTEWLAVQYARLPRAKTVAIVGLLADKDCANTIGPLLPWVDRWIAVNLLSENPERGSDGAQIMQFLQSAGKNCYTVATVAQAMRILDREHCQQRCERGLIFGSFYVVAAAKRFIEKEKISWKKKPNND